MMKNYHEAPKSIFKQVQQYTGGDYALVHLFETDPEYFNMFKQAVADDRDVILDNSLFELREAFDPEKYVYWIKQLHPTWIIVPDSWKNSKETIQMFFEFMNKYPEVADYSKIIGVAQGNNVEDVSATYNAIEPFCDKIAFNFDFSSYAEQTMIPYEINHTTTFERMSIGRAKLITALAQRGVINTCKPHHLLGCGVPYEPTMYPKNFTWIDSIDTCNPVMFGMHGISYQEDYERLGNKLPDKMCDHMNDQISETQWNVILENLKIMQQWCRQ